jgi:hypothetical protein
MNMSVSKINSGLGEQVIAALSAQLHGELIQPGDTTYAEARKVYNAMIDKRPALIVRCADVADVISAVNFGRENHLDVAVRSGGHNGPGFGTCDNGIVIDLSMLKGIRVDPDERVVRVEAGCLWRDVDHATHEFGLAVPCGVLSTTGVGGLTLGGGSGHLTRKYGLSIDNLLGVDMVLADGSFVNASKEKNPDLFWAVRGGGGNFGVVTSFLFKAHPVHTVYGGPIFWPMEKAADLLRFWQAYILNAPDDMNGAYVLVTIPPAPPFPEEYHLKKMCGVFWCYTGNLETAGDAFKPVRQFAPPAIDFAGPIPFPVLQGMFDPVFPPGLQWYWRGDFFNTYSDAAIDLHMKYGLQMPTMQSTMHIYPINGAASRVGVQDTAWGYRDANFSQVIAGVDPDPNNNPRLKEWTSDYWLATHPHSAGGGYVNFIMDEGLDRVKAAYGANYPRLAQIKGKYDPQNFFHINQNIKPAG